MVTLAEVKTILQITSTDNDTLITSNIPIIEQQICNYCNHDFLDNFDTAINSSEIIFINSTNSINLTGIESEKFKINDTIRVYNSTYNDGAYTIDSIITGKIVINSINSITDENEDKSVIIARVKYPIPLKLIAANLIGYTLQKTKQGFLSEKIDDYSYQIDKDMIGGYPRNLMIALNQYKRVYKDNQLVNKLIWWWN